MHRDLILDSGAKDTQTEEKTAKEEQGAGNKDQHSISREKRGDAFEDDRKNETQQDNSSPKDHFHLTEYEEADRVLPLFSDPVPPEKEKIKNDPFNHH
jgi:hypothetical protein